LNTKHKSAIRIIVSKQFQEFPIIRFIL
jgi:hypothetical protein